MENISDTTNKNTNRTGESYSNLKSSLYEAGSQAGEVAKKVAKDVKSAGSEGLHVAAEEGRKQLETMRHYVEANPIKSVVFGAMAGVLLNKIFFK